jgi:hypothetical protein
MGARGVERRGSSSMSFERTLANPKEPGPS